MTKNKTPQQRGRSNRRRGHDFERRIARELRDIYGSSVRRVPQYQKDHESADVSCPVFHPECKTGINPNARKALEQAMTTCPPGKWPIAVVKRRDKIAVLVTMRWDDFLDLIKEHWEAMGR